MTVAGGQSTTQDLGQFVFGPVAPIYDSANTFLAPNADANLAYVRGLYHVLLGRDASGTLTNAAGQNVSEAVFWVDQLEAGMSRQEVAYLIATSAEHYQVEVNFYYETLLGRSLVASPDPLANYWVGQLVAGATEASVVQGIMDSPEFQMDHPDDTSFVNAVYLDALGQPASSAQLSAGLAALSSGTTRSGLEAQVIGSTPSLQTQVAGFYAAFLHRQETDSNSVWVQMLSQGVSASVVEAGILADPINNEFFLDAQATVSPAVTAPTL